MSFDSLLFAYFFIPLVVLYYALPHKLRLWLIISASIVFYILIDPFTIWVPFLIAVLSYLAGTRIGKEKNIKRRKAILTLSVSIIIAILVFYKYMGFFITSFLHLATGVQPGFDATHLWATQQFFASLAVPLGISYLSFQSIGYLIEIDREVIVPEKRILKLATYFFFFPKIVAGPVERASHFLPELVKPIAFNYENVTAGIRQFGWGLFKKTVIADRLGLFVNSVYADVHQNNGPALLIAVFLFPIELYSDFSGYTDMARGISKILGYDLLPNFNHPFSAKSMVELWRRWHMSLSSWFSDFLYTPLAIQKRNWGKWSVVYASMLTFLVLGLWHGPKWTFVIFGGIQGCLIGIELFTAKPRKRIIKNTPKNINTFLGISYVFIAFSFSCIFFRAENVSETGYIISHFFSGIKDFFTMGLLKNSLMGQGLAIIDYLLILALVPFMFFVEGKDLLLRIGSSGKIVRWTVYYLFLMVIVVYSVPSGSAFIYKQF